MKPIKNTFINIMISNKRSKEILLDYKVAFFTGSSMIITTCSNYVDLLYNCLWDYYASY